MSQTTGNPDPTKPELWDYIGDGVYVEFDGFGIWLRANDPNSEKAVYLEPDVLDALNRFADRCKSGSPVETAEKLKPTDAQLRFRVGDLVEVTLDDGSKALKHVRIEPWQLGHGEWVVGLSGIPGGYRLTRCVLKAHAGYSLDPTTGMVAAHPKLGVPIGCDAVASGDPSSFPVMREAKDDSTSAVDRTAEGRELPGKKEDFPEGCGCLDCEEFTKDHPECDRCNREITGPHCLKCGRANPDGCSVGWEYKRQKQRDKRSTR